MRIVVNGEGREVAATTLEQVLLEFGLGDALVATALNQDFVPAGERAGRGCRRATGSRSSRRCREAETWTSTD